MLFPLTIKPLFGILVLCVIIGISAGTTSNYMIADPKSIILITPPTISPKKSIPEKIRRLIPTVEAVIPENLFGLEGHNNNGSAMT